VTIGASSNSLGGLGEFITDLGELAKDAFIARENRRAVEASTEAKLRGASREAARIVPVWSDAYLNLGAALAAQERHEEAVVALRRAVARDGGSHAARLRLANSLVELERTDEARVELNRVLELQPRDVPARLFLASLYQGAGDWRAAIHQFQQVLVLVPGTGEAGLAASRIVEIVDGWPEAPPAAQ